MKKIHLLSLLTFLCIGCVSNAQEKQTKETTMKNKMEKTEAQWKMELSPQEYYVLREKGTDRPSDDGYTLHFEDGNYACKGCGTVLFESENKFKAHCGWPSFDEAIEGTVAYKVDKTHGMTRTEIVCAKCDGHLGHVFNDGPRETTGKRYCVNTSSISFQKEE